MSDFNTAFDRLMHNEGGFTDNPKDPGNWTGGRPGVGELKGTKFGIAANTYPTLDIRNITLEQAHDIYYRDYWKAFGCDQFDTAIGFQVFDAAVNHRPQDVAKMLQRAAGVTVDGMIGAKTVAAVRALPVPKMIARFLAARLRFWASIPGDEFDDGWMNRAADNLDYYAQGVAT